MDMYLVPVLNAVLPRPNGGEVTGIFLDQATASLLSELGTGTTVLLCPLEADTGRIYPAGVITRLGEMWAQDVYVEGPGTRITALFAEVSADSRARPKSMEAHGHFVIARGVIEFDPADLRAQDYPVIDGAGWMPMGGHTEMRSSTDIPVTVYGSSFEGNEVGVTGNVGGAVTAEQAHTIEHAIIRSLQMYSMCTPKTLAKCITLEGQELRRSMEIGYQLKRPEIFGVTSSGACGNPLTNLAQFYLAKEMLSNISDGKSLLESIDLARKKALSRITDELDLTTEMGISTLQGLKKGMLHDDSPIAQKYCRKVLKRFPASPWH